MKFATGFLSGQVEKGGVSPRKKIVAGRPFLRAGRTNETQKVLFFLRKMAIPVANFTFPVASFFLKNVIFL